MSEPLAERLSRFTPDGTGLDRDALLFAAGRASAPLRRGWIALTGMLAASQVLTLVLLWPPTPAPAPTFAVTVPPTEIESSLPDTPDPYELRSLMQRILPAESDWPTPSSEDSMVPPAPPLRPYDTLPDTILN
jgi:hypothetical protein